MAVHRVKIVNPRLKMDWQPMVTTHALLRYAERVCGFDVARATAALSGKEVQTAILRRADAVCFGDLKVCLKGNVVVTVLGPAQKPRRGNRILKSFAELGDAA